MTERFKKAVKKYVSDCVLTQEEKSDLLKIAKEDGIKETDAIIYMNSELKKKISSKQTRKEVVDTIKDIGGVVVSVGGFALTVLAALGKLGDGKSSTTNKK